MRASRRPLPFLHIAVLVLACASVTRLVLALRTGMDAAPVGLWPGLLLRGVLFDLLVLAWVLAPAFLWAALTPARWRRTRWARPIRLLLFCALATGLLFVAVAEFTFWEEFSTRFNFIAVDYLIYTQEVVRNIRESYPIPLLLAAIAASALALTWVFQGPISRAPAAATSGLARMVYLVLAFALPTLAWQLADIDDMTHSPNAHANELSGNGMMTFLAAFRRNELDYARFYATLPDARAQALMAEQGVPRFLPPAAPPAPAPSEGPRLPLSAAPRHVVMISVESLSAKFLGAFGNPDGLTPRLDGLAREGLLFTKLYATGTRTVRGLEALSLGTPPIPGQAIVRRPGNEHLATLGEVLRPQGFEPYFFYGGYGYFDNMNAYYAANSYRVVDRTDFPRESVGFENVWGVGDEFLYDNVVRELDRAHSSGKRVFAQVMTTSNHRPFTYPAGRIDIPSPGGRDGAVKYTDWSIGHFIDAAKSRPWFRDTLFVIVADHCASAAGRTKLPVPGYHIPLILYAPALLAPGRHEHLASQIDIAPTLLDLLGARGQELFWGRSFFAAQRPARERAFISNYQELGYYTGDRLVVLGPRQKVEMYAVDAQGASTPIAVEPQLRDEAIAWYQTASQAFRTGGLKMPARLPRRPPPPSARARGRSTRRAPAGRPAAPARARARCAGTRSPRAAARPGAPAA